MKCGKTAVIPLIVAEMLKASGVEGTQPADPWSNRGYHPFREDSYGMGGEYCRLPYKCKNVALERGNYQGFTFLDQVMEVPEGMAENFPLRWRHNGHDGVPNHQPHHCLLNRLLGCTSKKISKLRVTGLCAGNSPGTGEFSAQTASNAENVSIWWRHHAITTSAHRWLAFWLHAWMQHHGHHIHHMPVTSSLPLTRHRTYPSFGIIVKILVW